MLEAVQAEPIATQNDLVRALRRRSIKATQVSVSRDIAQLGLIKVRGRYLPPPAEIAAPQPEQPFAAWVESWAQAGPHLVVIRCAVGAAARIALALDKARLPGVMGTLAGDDTVFAATASRAASRSLNQFLKARLPQS